MLSKLSALCITSDGTPKFLTGDSGGTCPAVGLEAVSSILGSRHPLCLPLSLLLQLPPSDCHLGGIMGRCSCWSLVCRRKNQRLDIASACLWIWYTGLTRIGIGGRGGFLEQL